MSFLNGVNSKYFFDSLIALLKNKWLPFVLGVPLFFCLHHYEGIGIDAKLYLLQVVHLWSPERFVNDVPFMFGNQDSYGIFTTLYAPIIKLWGVSLGAKLFCIVMHFLLVCSSLFMIREICKKTSNEKLFLPLAILFVLLGANSVDLFRVSFFPFVQGYTCSRMLSLSFGIFGLTLMIREKQMWSLLLISMGTLIHPITAGWCLPIWMFYNYPKTKLIVFLLSLPLPLTFLFHMGKFDIYPTDWGNSIFGHDITSAMIIKEYVAVLFFGVFCKKISANVNEPIAKLLNASFVVLLIGLYWTVTGGVFKHILIYQCQTWRVEWIMWVLLVPTYFIFLKKIVYNVRQKHEVTRRELIFFLLCPFLFICNFDFVFLSAMAIFYLRKDQKISFDSANNWLIFLSIFGFVLQVWTEFSLLGVGNLSVMNVLNYSELRKTISFFALLSGSLALIELIYMVKMYGFSKKITVAFLFLVAFVLFPRFCVLPICIGLLLRKRFSVLLVVVALIVLVCDGMTMLTPRMSNIVEPIFSMFAQINPYIIILCLSGVFLFIPNAKVQTCMFVLLSISLAVNAIYGYDNRSDALKDAEDGMDFFVEKTIFPQVENRGRMLYYVEGELVQNPRTQFLTGAYIDNIFHIGEPLFEGQFHEARKRDNYLFFKENLNFSSPRSAYNAFLKDKMSNPDTLLDRTIFLCEMNEISNLVTTTKGLPLTVQDSLVLSNDCRISDSRIIYLYGCPNAKD